MTQLEAYLFLFADSFMATLIFPVQEELVLPVLRIFATYNSLLIILIATFASMIATCINVWIGRILNHVKIPTADKSQKESVFYSATKRIAPILLLMSCFPILGGVFSVMAGYVKASYKHALLFSMIGNLAYYLLG